MTANQIESADPKTYPCYEYGIYIYRYSKTEYEFVYNYVTSRPDVTSYSYSEPPFSGNYLITIQCKGISNFLYSDSVYKSIKNWILYNFKRKIWN